jgi:hypothetical protein
MPNRNIYIKYVTIHRNIFILIVNILRPSYKITTFSNAFYPKKPVHLSLVLNYITLHLLCYLK